MKELSSFNPPRWADRLLEKFCRGDYLEEIQGDLRESFYWRLETKGKRHAQWKFIWETFLSFRMSNLKSYYKMDQLLTLFKSHIKTGWRFLWKTKAYSSINILGLSVGIVFSWFAYLYTADQLSYNKHIKQVDHLYKMTSFIEMFGNQIFFPGSSHLNTQRILDEIPEVLEMARFREDHSLMKFGESFVDQDYLIAEPQLMDYLGLDFVEGDMGDFKAANQAIISEQLAYKLRIRGDAVNKNIQLRDSTNYVSYKVVGVFKEIPENTSIKTDLFLPYATYLNDSDALTNRGAFDLSTLLRLDPVADPKEVNDKINALFKEEGSQSQYLAKIDPLADLHLSKSYASGNGFQPGGSTQLIWFITAAGILCLIISIINYANFSISLYVNRSREVAVRKIMGSARGGIFQQLMTESFLTTVLAAIVAIFLFWFIAPQFSELVEKSFGLPDLLTWQTIPGIFAIIVLISFLSGIYPSILLSRFQIVNSLKGVQKLAKGKFVMQSLLIIQFSISVAMIACMLTFKGQLNYLLTFDRGINVDNVLKLNLPVELLNSGYRSELIYELQQIPEISTIVLEEGLSMQDFHYGESKFFLLNRAIDSSYIDLFEIDILQGTDLKTAKEDGVANGVLVNEAFLRNAKVLDDPIGETINFGQGGHENSVIVGVLRDFYTNSPRGKVEPTAFYARNPNSNVYSIYLKSEADRFVIEEKLEAAWDKVYDPIPLNYDYLSTVYQRSFEKEQKISKIATTGSFIAIFIAAFGFLGLVGLTIQRTLKEVSVRRVLGARIEDLSALMLKKFALVIVISLSGGLTAAFYLAREWLTNYHNQIDYGWQQVAYPAIIILVLLVLIIFAQVFRVIQTNPITHLKDD